MSVFLGIDVGTSGTKTLAIREDGEILASATVEYPLSTPKPGWSEQDPEHWWQAAVQSVQQVLAKGKITPGDVAGIGLSGQMHGSVFLNQRHDVIRPAILWNDQRTTAECREIEAAVGGRSKLIDLVANPALEGFTAPKILWLRTHEPEYFEQTVQVLLPKDYVRFRLTGEFATEVSDASGTLLLDVKNRKWSQALLDVLQLDADLLPKVYESEEVSGKLTAKAAELLGLKAGVPVVGGGGDQAAGAVGNGIVEPGAISATMGTSGVVFAYSDEVQIDPQGSVHTFCHAVRGKWHVMGVVLSAAGSLQWYRNQLAASEVAVAKALGVDPYQIICDEAAQAPLGSEGLYFLPYLTGERTPHCDASARGSWVGLSLRHGRAHLARSVMEGATFALRDCLRIIQEMHIPVSEIRLSGGGAKGAFWRQLQANIYGQEVVTINAEEGPAFGVALLAAVGTGAYNSIQEACKTTIKVTNRVPHDSKAKSFYDDAYPIYRRLYDSLKAEFQAIAELNLRWQS
jgi:xylulokinase